MEQVTHDAERWLTAGSEDPSLDDDASSPAPRFVRRRWPRSSSIRVSLVIPAMNEERNIGWVLERLPDSIDEVILVDGNSVDDTVAVSRAIRPDIRVVGQTRPGKGNALRSGFAAARGDVIVMIDADCSMDPAEIDRFLDLLDEGYDLVKGSRFMDGGGTEDMELVRRLGNRVLRGFVNTLYRQRFTDLCYGYSAFRRDSLPAMALNADGFEIETEIIVRAVRSGLRIGEVPSFEAPRANGESNLNTWRDGQRVLRTLLRHRFTRPRAGDPIAAAPLERAAPAVEFATGQNAERYG
jgi:glycosyltransferase involved in cell wall biosynthesis